MRATFVSPVGLFIAVVAGGTTAGAADGAPAIYFDRNRFRSVADCLTAAHAQRLPLELCR